MTNPKPYAAILPTILCQQPAVILHWLNEQRASGNLPVEIVLDVLVELVSRQVASVESKSSRELINAHNAMYDQLEVYKRAVKAMKSYIEYDCDNASVQQDCNCPTCSITAEYIEALIAVDKLEGVE